MNNDNKIGNPIDPLSKVYIHNKSSNLAFCMNEKVELLEEGKQYGKGEVSDKRNKIKSKSKKRKSTKEIPTEKSQSELTCNSCYDDERGDYKARIGEIIGYRFEIKGLLGKGSFGQAFKCWDHKEKEFVALKIIRNKKNLQYQANVEVKVLTHLK